jgi:hypothetical protein
MKKVIPLLLLLASIIHTHAQDQKRKPEVSIVFGLNQPLVLKGFNFEVDYWMKKFVLEYSHGFALEFTGGLVSQEAQDQRLSFHIRNSLGIGLGYRFTDAFNLRLEPKWHQWDVYYDDAFRKPEGKITSYNTFTLGLGAYYEWLPFEKKNNALRGVTIVPSIRWWPTVASSLQDNEYSYHNKFTDRQEIHEANNIGIANSPLFLNISIGYTFKGRKS